MKFTSLLSAFFVAGQAHAVAVGGKVCAKDACLTALVNTRNGKADCQSFLATTVSAGTVTTTKTHVVTITPTVYDKVSKTAVLSETATKTVSKVLTTNINVATTKTVVTTVRSTTTDAIITLDVKGGLGLGPVVGNVGGALGGLLGGLKERAVPPAQPTYPVYAKVCGDIPHYASACSCIGASAVTKTAAGPTKTVTVNKTVNGPAKHIPTTVATVTKPKVVATVQVTDVYTTKTAYHTTATHVVTRTVTTIVHATATKLVNVGVGINV